MFYDCLSQDEVYVLGRYVRVRLEQSTEYSRCKTHICLDLQNHYLIYGKQQ